MYQKIQQNSRNKIKWAIKIRGVRFAYWKIFIKYQNVDVNKSIKLAYTLII
jgi:hypothetical protein